ncbi:GNAT family N-acetyltransferase [Aliiroseovarius sp. Z3]|uniref:GNAT family N-acetyltransferase n=1 Tax=Aliiroseovarius sp. Z3 TaxID=2811402 RepID=UPI0023B26D73|nr:GNAT family N-acetyltransferase [Aliiroseovarius sp. Z3]MDE9449517.1 GNAT family N-acetyltransferase [Aliiroseovarius sp. Z3]
MPSKRRIIPIDPEAKQLVKLAVEAEEQGYAFVDRLIQEAKSGENGFNEKGECFCGVFLDGELVGCGGINVDPYIDQKVGRLRHVYILKRNRRAGVASALVHNLLERSKPAFSSIRLRTSDRNADKFYEALGFSRTDEENATHIIKI